MPLRGTGRANSTDLHRGARLPRRIPSAEPPAPGAPARGGPRRVLAAHGAAVPARSHQPLAAARRRSASRADHRRHRHRQRGDARALAAGHFEPRSARSRCAACSSPITTPTIAATRRGWASASAPSVDDPGRVPDRPRAVRERGGLRHGRVLRVFTRNGLATRASGRRLPARGNHYRELVPELPLTYRRVIDGDRWRSGCTGA